MSRLAQCRQRIEESFESAGPAQAPEPLPDAVPLPKLFRESTPSDVVNHEILQGFEKPPIRVERSFYQRAIGYDVKTTRTVSKTGDGSVTETIEHLPGDVTAQMKWLSIRRPKQWREQLPDGAQPERSSAEIKEIILQKLTEWGLKIVPIEAPTRIENGVKGDADKS